ncbi:hypothetical protein BDV3_006562 [Batrachochytrium dendrobatidis]|nr:hypothetical protein QVD99_004477 [Batrachochytrium dendrobatidis]
MLVAIIGALTLNLLQCHRTIIMLKSNCHREKEFAKQAAQHTIDKLECAKSTVKQRLYHLEQKWRSTFNTKSSFFDTTPMPVPYLDELVRRICEIDVHMDQHVEGIVVSTRTLAYVVEKYTSEWLSIHNDVEEIKAMVAEKGESKLSIAQEEKLAKIVKKLYHPLFKDKFEQFVIDNTHSSIENSCIEVEEKIRFVENAFIFKERSKKTTSKKSAWWPLSSTVYCTVKHTILNIGHGVLEYGFHNIPMAKPTAEMLGISVGLDSPTPDQQLANQMESYRLVLTAHKERLEAIYQTRSQFKIMVDAAIVATRVHSEALLKASNPDLAKKVCVPPRKHEGPWQLRYSGSSTSSFQFSYVSDNATPSVCYDPALDGILEVSDKHAMPSPAIQSSESKVDRAIRIQQSGSLFSTSMSLAFKVMGQIQNTIDCLFFKSISRHTLWAMPIITDIIKSITDIVSCTIWPTYCHKDLTGPKQDQEYQSFLNSAIPTISSTSSIVNRSELSISTTTAT